MSFHDFADIMIFRFRFRFRRAKDSGMCDIPNSSYSVKHFTENYSV